MNLIYEQFKINEPEIVFFSQLNARAGPSRMSLGAPDRVYGQDIAAVKGEAAVHGAERVNSPRGAATADKNVTTQRSASGAQLLACMQAIQIF
jgi:hypothetical protein